MTIAGESAGSIAVSAQMASPLSKDLIAGAIGESGALLGDARRRCRWRRRRSRARSSRASSSATIAGRRCARCPPSSCSRPAGEAAACGALPVDDRRLLLPEGAAREIFAAGEQAHVPLLAGWNSEEMTARARFWKRGADAGELREGGHAAVQGTTPTRS